MIHYYIIYNRKGLISAYYAGEDKLGFGTEVTREEYDEILTKAGIDHVMPEEPTPTEPEPTADEILNTLLGVTA